QLSHSKTKIAKSTPCVRASVVNAKRGAHKNRQFAHLRRFQLKNPLFTPKILRTFVKHVRTFSKNPKTPRNPSKIIAFSFVIYHLSFVIYNALLGFVHPFFRRPHVRPHFPQRKKNRPRLLRRSRHLRDPPLAQRQLPRLQSHRLRRRARSGRRTRRHQK